MSELRVSRGTDLPRLPFGGGIDITPSIGKTMSLNVVFLEPNAVADVHVHDEEQFGYIVTGTCTITDGKTSQPLAPGDVYHALPNIPHGITAHDDGCTIVDVFSPPRAAVVKMLEQLNT